MAFCTEAQPGDSGAVNSYEYLGRRLESKIKEFDWGGGTVHAIFTDLEHGLTLFEEDAEESLAPGSAIKLFTAAAALERLGGQHRFATELFMRGDAVKGELTGAILVRGSGDPTIGRSADEDNVFDLFNEWSAMLRDRGVKKLNGPLQLDASAFDGDAIGPAWPIERLGDPSMPEIGALNFNDNCVSIVWAKGKKPNETAPCAIFPPLENVAALSNNVLLKNYPDAPRAFRRQVGMKVITATGDLRVKTEAIDRAGVHSPETYFGEAMLAAMAAKKIDTANATVEIYRERSEIPSAEEFRIIDLHRSAPLETIIAEMLRQDRNLDAEVLLKTLGREASGEAGGFRNGRAAAREALASARVPISGVAMLDGSGLSVMNRATPKHLIGVMEFLRRRHGQVLDSGLPKPGEPGPLENRFGAGEGGDPAETEIGAIASRSNNTIGLTGLAKSRGGLPIYFAFFVANSGLSENTVHLQIDAVVKEISRSLIR